MNANPLFIGVCGASASGKTTLANKLQKRFSSVGFEIVSLDNYYRNFSEIETQNEEINFDLS